MHPARPRLRLVLVAALTGATLAFLVAARPSPTPSPWADGDELALAASWAVVLVTSAWLFTGSVACLLALGTRRPDLARSLARVLPPSVRRAVDIAIVASCLAVSAAPARAASTDPGVVVDQPVVRAPRTMAVPPVSAPVAGPRSDVAQNPPPTAPPRRRAVPATTATTFEPQRATPTVPAPPTESERREPAALAPRSARPATGPATARSVVVRPGDNLWVIARAELIRTQGAHPRDDAIARYWLVVIDANRATLRSGTPSVIFPGEFVTLPAVAGVS